MKFFKIILALFVAAIFFNACQKDYSIENNGLKLHSGTWQFTENTHSFAGNMDSAFLVTNGATNELHLNGTSSDGSQNFNMVLYADTFKMGSYKASLFQSSFNYTTTAKTIYQANQLVGEFIVNITSLASNLVSGTFSGTALDSSGNLVNITLGKFQSTIGGQTTIPVSEGVLGDSLGNCKPVVLNGTYTGGITTTSANTVQIQVTITTPGTYSISTNSVNGISFSGTGIFTNAGVQNVTLAASGTPTDAGNQVFTLSYGNSQCAFQINFTAGASPSNDYFPLTLNSNWTYANSSSDSVFRKVINYSPTINGKSYNTITQSNLLSPATVTDSFYYRKPGGDYYQYITYSSQFGFDNPVSGEFIFLKDNVPAGTTWQSDPISGTSGGIAISMYAKMTILAKAVPATVGGFNFPDIIKVKYEYYVSVQGNPPAIAYTMERWFAKNSGEIYYRLSDSSTDIYLYQIGKFIVF
ncbi:MAG: hypothetical protein Q8891_05555 [Bacteroidota bacterium]|jgi:hypothetical protein|nr:hypothetical protein [Bacteroidota bacterium]